MNTSSYCLKSLLAGMLIAVACVIYLLLDSNIIGSAVFSLGLYFICFLDLNLYTGKIGWYKGKDTLWYLLLLVLNLTGVTYVCAAMGFAQIDVEDAALAIMQKKFELSYLALFFRAFFCGMFMALAVAGYKKGHSLAILLGVMGFILAGFDHSIADFAYSLLAGMDSSFLLRELIIILGNSIGSWITVSILECE